MGPALVDRPVAGVEFFGARLAAELARVAAELAYHSPSMSSTSATSPSRKWPFIVGGVALTLLLLVGGAFGYLAYAGVPLSELGELFARDPIERLDPTLEVHPGGDRVVVFALDGVGDHIFHDAIASGAMPRLAARLGDSDPDDERVHAHGWVAPDALSILPSTTVAAWSATFTGEPVAHTGVPGNEWFAREEMRFYAPAPVSVHGNADTLHALNDGLVGDAIAVPTVFERLDGPSYVSLNPVNRGADLYTVPDPTAFADLFGAMSEGFAPGTEVDEELYRHIDRDSIDSVIEAFDQHGLPTLQVVYFPGVDLYSHVAEDALDEQRQYLSEVLDPAMDRVLSYYEARGESEHLWVMVVSDHGHTPVLADDTHSLGVGDPEEEPDEPTALLSEVGFRVRPFELETDVVDYQAVVAYQGAIAYVYLADRSSCPDEGQRCEWSRAPRMAEDVLPVVRAIDAANQRGVDDGGLGDALELIFAREPRPIGEPTLPFQIWDGERLVDVGAFLIAHPHPHLLDLEERMRALSEGPMGHRAGDVLLLSHSGLDRPIEERFYFSGPYRSWHGSPNESDSNIIFTVLSGSTDGAGVRNRVRGIVEGTPSQLDVTRVILDLAGS